MKFSLAFIPTRREAPQDAEAISHQLLCRSGAIRRVAAGIYDYLPLGFAVLQKVTQIVREEMVKAGCQEVFLPHLVPAELWQESGRWQKYGKELLRLKDRHDREYCFGPTHEEVIVDLARASLASYKSLPFHLFQIQTKFRDERRPRFGLMRGREFLMKDGYSFHASTEDLDKEYQKMFQAYSQIFKRCGLKFRAVNADTGAIGGTSSHEFMVLAPRGEDTIASCSLCDYAANLEKATTKNLAFTPTENNLALVHTPNIKSVADVANFLKTSPAHILKTMVYKISTDSYLAVCVAGHKEVHPIKLARALQIDEPVLASEAEILALLNLTPGFIGPVGLIKAYENSGSKASLQIVLDRTALQTNVCGGNQPDAHYTGLNLERDADFLNHEQTLSLVDVVAVSANEPCPECLNGALQLTQGIEVGHIFKLGTRYSAPMNLKYLDTHGKEQTVIMGTYGIGVGRTMAASIEQNHDDKGIIWPMAIAPYQVTLLQLDFAPPLNEFTISLYQKLQKHQIEVLFDDRDERAGVKFNDADLIGIPLQVVIGNKGFTKGIAEIKVRATSQKIELPLDQVLDWLLDFIKRELN